MDGEQFARVWAATRAVEKGYVHHPDDPGGETNHGVTVRLARRYGYAGAMRDLPEPLAVSIAKREFWDPLELDAVAAVAPRVAAEVFDSAFLMGPRWPVLWLQRALNALNLRGAQWPDLVVDGNLSGSTVAALRACIARRGAPGELVILRTLNGLQVVSMLEQCERTPGKESFFFGWVLNRVQI